MIVIHFRNKKLPIAWWIFGVLIFINHGWCDTNFKSTKDEFYLLPASKNLICKQVNAYYSATTMCQCDETQCQENGKCCEDKKNCPDRSRAHDNFTCIPTLFHGGISMRNECLPIYPSTIFSNMINRCQTTDESLLNSDFLLNIPVTNSRNVTYRNMYCAICNNEDTYTFWNVALQYEPHTKNDSQNSHDKIDPYSILTNLTMDKLGTKLISNVNGTTFNLKVHGYLPNSLTAFVHVCNATTTKPRKCPVCQEVQQQDDCSYEDVLFLNLRNSYLPKSNILYYKLTFESPPGKYWFRSLSPIYLDDEIVNCFPEKNPPKTCLVNKFLRLETQFNYTKNDKNEITIPEFNGSYGPDDWSYTLDDDVIYFCGRSTPEYTEAEFYESIRKIVVTTLDITSIIFLIALLLDLCTNGMDKLKGLAYKITFSLSITLLGQLTAQIIFADSTCYVCAAADNYFYLSYFMWLLLSAYNYWSVITLSSSKLQSVAGKRYLIKYLIFCFFGWGLPLLVVAVGIYFDYVPASEIRCELKPGYGKTGRFIRPNSLPFDYFYYYPVSTNSILVLILFALTSCQMYRMKRNSIQSTAARTNDYIFFVKLALLTGSSWAIYYTLYTFFTDSYILLIISAGFNAAQGIFIFYINGCKARTVGNIYSKFKSMTTVTTSDGRDDS